MNPAKILHIITTLEDGGAEAALYRLCSVPSQDEHHVITLMHIGKYGPLLEAAGIAVTCLNMPAARVTLKGLGKLWDTMRKIRPDVVQTWMYHSDLLGGITARLAGIRNVHWGIHNSALVRGQNAMTTIIVARICAVLSHVVPRTIICCARKAADAHISLGYKATGMRIVRNGYDLTIFQPDADQRVTVRTELGIGKEEVLIGFVARYDPAKDHSNLLRALAILKHRGNCPRCLLVGNGMEPTNGMLTRAIDEYDVADRVLLLGRRSDIPAVMNALDIHVMSSSTEAFPNVIAEAMACGTPCISTDVGDAADILGGSGWLVPSLNSDALAEAIEVAVAARHAPGWEARRESARHWIGASFSLDQMSRGYRQIWHDSLRRPEAQAGREGQV